MKYANPKLLLLHLRSLLLEETDADNGLTMEQIRLRLIQSGFDPDRKSIYACMDALESFGMEIQRPSGRRKDYRLLRSQDELELSEIKLLIDAIQASRFLSSAKAGKLTAKLEKLVSRRQAATLHRQVIVSDRVKSMNNSLYYQVDALHTAIAQDRKVTFRYFDYNMSKKRVYRHDGKHYRVSPFAMVYNNDKYYLLAVPEEEAALRTYRVDKLDGVTLLEDAREGHEVYAGVDAAAYTRVTFSMYAGEVQPVTLQFENSLLNAAMDRFGHNIAIARHGEDHFRFTVPVAVSPRFYGWLLGFGSGAEIISPPEVRRGMAELVGERAAHYGRNDSENE